MHCIEVVSGISGDVGCFAIAALKLVVRSMSGGDYGGAYIALSTGANTFERVISSSWLWNWYALAQPQGLLTEKTEHRFSTRWQRE
jgi:hypothetical protein